MMHPHNYLTDDHVAALLWLCTAIAKCHESPFKRMVNHDRP